MSCEEERSSNEEALDAMKEAQLSMETARRKAKNALKVAGATCVGGAISSLFGPVALIAGGGACITSLLVADDAAADFEEAAALYDLAREKSAESFQDLYLCMSHCQQSPAQA